MGDAAEQPVVLLRVVDVEFAHPPCDYTVCPWLIPLPKDMLVRCFIGYEK